MPRGEPSRADTELIQALADQGLTVSHYQLERWRATGQLPRNRRRALGRGKGSVSELDSHAVRQAATLARATRRGRQLPGGHVLDRFIAGKPVTEAAVRAAYLDRLERLGHLIAADAGEGDEGWQARYDAAKRLTRRARADGRNLLDVLLDRPEQNPAVTDKQQRQAFRTFTQALARGGDARLEEVAEAFAIFGAAPAGDLERIKADMREAELSGTSTADELAHALSLSPFREALDQVSYGDLHHAALIYFEAWMYQSLIMLAGMWTIAAEMKGNPETVAPGFREIDRATVEQMVADPIYQSWGANQDMFMRNRHDVLVLGSLGLVRLPELLRVVEGYRDRLSVIHERMHQAIIEATEEADRQQREGRGGAETDQMVTTTSG